MRYIILQEIVPKKVILLLKNLRLHLDLCFANTVLKSQLRTKRYTLYTECDPSEDERSENTENTYKDKNIFQWQQVKEWSCQKIRSKIKLLLKIKTNFYSSFRASIKDIGMCTTSVYRKAQTLEREMIFNAKMIYGN